MFTIHERFNSRERSFRVLLKIGVGKFDTKVQVLVSARATTYSLTSCTCDKTMHRFATEDPIGFERELRCTLWGPPTQQIHTTLLNLMICEGIQYV